MDVLAIGFYPEDNEVLISCRDGSKHRFIKKDRDKPCKDMMKALHTNFAPGLGSMVFEEVDFDK
jgi:hypothetical protein